MLWSLLRELHRCPEIDLDARIDEFKLMLRYMPCEEVEYAFCQSRREWLDSGRGRGSVVLRWLGTGKVLGLFLRNVVSSLPDKKGTVVSLNGSGDGLLEKKMAMAHPSLRILVVDSSKKKRLRFSCAGIEMKEKIDECLSDGCDLLILHWTHPLSSTDVELIRKLEPSKILYLGAVKDSKTRLTPISGGRGLHHLGAEKLGYHEKILIVNHRVPWFFGSKHRFPMAMVLWNSKGKKDVLMECINYLLSRVCMEDREVWRKELQAMRRCDSIMLDSLKFPKKNDEKQSLISVFLTSWGVKEDVIASILSHLSPVLELAETHEKKILAMDQNSRVAPRGGSLLVA